MTAPTQRWRPRTPRGDDGLGLRWWREGLYVLGFYFIYSFIRNRFGSASVGIEPA